MITDVDLFTCPVLKMVFLIITVFSIREVDLCLPSCISILIGADICTPEYQLTGPPGVTRNGVNAMYSWFLCFIL